MPTFSYHMICSFKWCEGGWGLSRKERSKFRSFDCQTAVLTLGLYGESVVMCLFSMVSYLLISTIALWLVYYLKQHFTKWQVFKCTVFINFQFNRQIIKELFKSNLMKFWKIVDGFLIFCVNFINRRKGWIQFKEVNKLVFWLVPALEI